MAEESVVSQVVVVGASAGGIEALSAFLGALPASLSAPVVIAQHLDPTRASYLEEILARRSPLPVRTVRDRAPLQAGVVYVAPPNRHVEVTNDEVQVTPDHGGPHPSVGMLFVSAARSFGEGVVAVILTGLGSDGAAGARAVKTAGGMVMIQDPASASFPSMPLSLAPTTVDLAAPVDRLGGLVQALLADAAPGNGVREGPGLRTFLDQVRVRQGIDFGSYRAPTILRRLHRRLVATGTSTLADYQKHLDSHPDEYQCLIQTFLIKVTEFFRDRELFDFLREQVLPSLIEQARREGRGLRCWSAGCATGEEAYSLAILIRDLMGDELEQFGTRIFATDLDADAVAFARRGVYPALAITNVQPEMVARYFTRQNGEFAVKKRVRGMIVFGQQDLGQRVPFPHIDLVLCRNVLIYFTPELQRRVLQLFAFALRDGGILALGKAESTHPLADYFEAEQPRLKVYRRRGGRILFPPAQLRDVTTAPTRPSRPAAGGAARLRVLPPVAPTVERPDDLLAELSVGVVVVDRRYDIRTINLAARRVFGIHGAAIGDDFLHLIQTVSPSLLRPSIDASFRGETPPQEEVTAVDSGTGETRFLHVHCRPRRSNGESGSVETVLVQVIDDTVAAKRRRATEDDAARQAQEQAGAREAQARALAAARAETGRLEAQVQALTTANQQLRAANEDLVSVNGELRSASEEYLISSEEAQAATEEVETLNEELQATNEELETLNEELQSTVEELETLNEELQSTVEELHATNDDLEARTAELRDLAARSEAERSRLEAILAGLSDAVLVVDAAGRPDLTNAVYERFFGDPARGLAAEDGDGRTLPFEASPQGRAAAGETFTMRFAARQPDGDRRQFEARGQPISNGGERQGVVVIRDVTATRPDSA